MDTAAANIAKPTRSHARKLIVASLALVVCRIVSQWDSMAAGSAALVILAVLAASIVASMPRVRRVVLVVALPMAVLLNAVVFACGAFVTLLGVQGLLAYGRLGSGPPWTWIFAAVPLASAVNLVALARPMARWLLPAWLANLASACYVVWHWRSDDVMGFAVPVATAVLVSLTILSLATITWDTRNQASLQSVRPFLPRRRRHVLGTAALIACLLWLGLVPVYRKRQVARSLDAFGLRANFGLIFPGWRLPFELPFDCYEYLGEVTGAAAPDTLKGDAIQAGRLLNTLPWLDFVAVHYLPADGARILQPLAGHQRLRQIALHGVGVTDATLADAGQIPGLNRAVFINARFTDEGLANLAGAKWLQQLVICHTPIGGNGLISLSLLPRLVELDLSGTDIRDSQMSALPRFKALSTLSLNDTPLTDRGLACLAQCKTLRVIDLSGTRVTVSGVEWLERALPSCTVIWNRTADEP